MRKNRKDKQLSIDAAFYEAIADLLRHPSVLKMQEFNQHGPISCLDHSLFVAYTSYRICRLFKLDAVSAARGGLLHDLFLYDWRDEFGHCKPHMTWHPRAAYKNASKICDLNEIEKDCIVKHMWPVTFRFPDYKESFIVSSADKYCALAELLKIYRIMRTPKRIKTLGYSS